MKQSLLAKCQTLHNRVYHARACHPHIFLTHATHRCTANAGEEDAPLDDDLTAVNAAALRMRVRELEVENSLIQRELAHVGELAERQGQQLQCGPAPESLV